MNHYWKKGGGEGARETERQEEKEEREREKPSGKNAECYYRQVLLVLNDLMSTLATHTRCCGA